MLSWAKRYNHFVCLPNLANGQLTFNWSDTHALSLSVSFAYKGMKELRDSFVIVVGLGGVGSHAAHMLLRSGVQHLRLIDFDQVSLSSLNRHAVAKLGDVGTSKVNCLEKHFKAIFPSARIECYNELYNEESADRLLAGNPAYVLGKIWAKGGYAVGGASCCFDFYMVLAIYLTHTHTLPLSRSLLS